MKLRLQALQDEIDARVAAIRAQQPDWLCRKGCDACCRRLADLPRMTAAEWHLLRVAVAALSPAQRDEIERGNAALAAQPPGNIVCPLLDQATGACQVYAQRPLACRSYGYYVQRARGLYCDAIEAQVVAGMLADVIWGNHEAIDRRLAALGEVRTLGDWMAVSSASSGAPDSSGDGAGETA